MNIIQCFAPTNDYNEDAKDQFYNILQSIIEKCLTKDLTILMGDFNAKVGTDNTGCEDNMGRHGLGERNENGERFANLCAFNKPNRPYLHQQNVQEDYRGRENQVRS
ncbi:unnamed protein product [Schistosoma margrebowiei]|uniref:Uncharacterized protein n=1 Tax=Schistosoma margrebowiei TaxID=48269 RepID=A0A183N395_9TREM|nr:unnamed protein product [Schistosoma margrebowiei]